jgi:hypothetical protein
MKQSRATAGVVATVGAVFLPLGFVLAPAQAALLDFSFTTQRGGTGFFTLDTSVENTVENQFNPDAFFGNLPNAISGFTFSRMGQTATSDGILKFEATPSGTTFRINSAGYGGGLGPVSQVGLFFSSPSDPNPSDLNFALPSDPSQYVPRAYFESFLGYVIFSTGGGPDNDSITSVSVAAHHSGTSVPEPTSTVSLVALGLLGAGCILKKKKASSKSA